MQTKTRILLSHGRAFGVHHSTDRRLLLAIFREIMTGSLFQTRYADLILNLIPRPVCCHARLTAGVPRGSSHKGQIRRRVARPVAAHS